MSAIAWKKSSSTNATHRPRRIHHARRRTPKIVRGWDFKIIVGRVLGWNLLKSSRFEVSRSGANFVFRGSGFGHGLGLCQEGAHVMAARGASYQRILEKYFPGTRVGRDSGRCEKARLGRPDRSEKALTRRGSDVSESVPFQSISDATIFFGELNSAPSEAGLISSHYNILSLRVRSEHALRNHLLRALPRHLSRRQRSPRCKSSPDDSRKRARGLFAPRIRRFNFNQRFAVSRHSRKRFDRHLHRPHRSTAVGSGCHKRKPDRDAAARDFETKRRITHDAEA